MEVSKYYDAVRNCKNSKGFSEAYVHEQGGGGGVMIQWRTLKSTIKQTAVFSQSDSLLFLQRAQMLAWLSL